MVGFIGISGLDRSVSLRFGRESVSQLRRGRCLRLYGVREGSKRRGGAVRMELKFAEEDTKLTVKTKDIFMPALSSTMTEGKVVQWLKKPGEFVKEGEIIMVVESDKADMDVESFEEGQ